jgi:hypothetical protein
MLGVLTVFAARYYRQRFRVAFCDAPRLNTMAPDPRAEIA